MNKWSVQGKVVELSDYDFYNQWVGMIMLTNDLGGLLGGYFDMHDQNGNLLEKHSEYLHENINLVEDKIFRALLTELETQFMKIVALDQEAVATLAQVLGVAKPEKPQDYRALYKKFERENHRINGFLSHPAFDELRQRFFQILEKRSFLKEKLVAYIIAAHPDVAQSEYLLNR
jgi:hypothetical protein